MRSDMHKVLHPIAGRPLLLHLLDRVDGLGADKRVVVVGKGREQVEAALAGRDVDGRASRPSRRAPRTPSSRPPQALEGYDGAVLILYADTPFVEAATLKRMLDRLDARRRARRGRAWPRARPIPRPMAGSSSASGDRIAKMVEFRDATEEERAVTPVQQRHDGGARGATCSAGWPRSATTMRRGEYYLPDVVNIAAAEGREAVVIEGDPYETAGVNSRAELAHLELEWQRRRREQALEEGATLIDPESVWFAYDTKLGRDVTVEPHVVFGAGGRGRRRRLHQGVQPYRGGDHRRAGQRRAVRADPAGHQARPTTRGSAISSSSRTRWSGAAPRSII